MKGVTIGGFLEFSIFNFQCSHGKKREYRTRSKEGENDEEG